MRSAAYHTTSHQQVLDGDEADQALLHRVAHRGRDLAFGEVLQKAQHLAVLALAVGAEAGFKEMARRVKGGTELPSPQWCRLVQGVRLLF